MTKYDLRILNSVAGGFFFNTPTRVAAVVSMIMQSLLFVTTIHYHVSPSTINNASHPKDQRPRNFSRDRLSPLVL